MSRKIRTRICIGPPPRLPDENCSYEIYQARLDNWEDDCFAWHYKLECFVMGALFWDRLWFALTGQACLTLTDGDLDY